MQGMPPDRIHFFDTTLRDGEQSPGCSMTQHGKARDGPRARRSRRRHSGSRLRHLLRRRLSPPSTVAREVRGPVIASLARARSADIERAAQLSSPPRNRASTSFSPAPTCTSSTSSRSPASEALEQAAQSVALARSYVDDVEFSPEDATRSDLDFLCKMVTVTVEAGAHHHQSARHRRLLHARRLRAMFRMMRERVPGADKVILSSHCHDDLGLAVAKASPRSRPESARSSAPSTASANAPATPRSKRSPPRCMFAATDIRISNSHELSALSQRARCLER